MENTSMVQIEELREFIDYSKKNGYLTGVPEEKLEALIEALKNDAENLKYSNDDTIDMIVDKVWNHTKSGNLKMFLTDVRIANIPVCLERLNAMAHFSVNQGYQVKAGRSFLRMTLIMMGPMW